MFCRVYFTSFRYNGPLTSTKFMKNRPLLIVNSLALSLFVAISFVACRPNQDANQGIVFYGKLRDQTSASVADAEVTARVTSKSGSAGPTPIVLRTDSDGVFQLKQPPGATVELNVQKSGFALADTNTTIQFSPSQQSDSQRPVIIKMWKLQGPEPLATLSATGRFENPGVPIYFDLLTKKFGADSGDIKITLNRPDGMISSSEHPNWSAHVETVGDGGLIEVTPQIWRTTHWAPTDGYEPQRQLLVSTNGPLPWSTNAQALYFVQSRQGGVYTKLSVKIQVNSDPKQPYQIDLAGVMNTNGSCNWESDIGSMTKL